MPVTLGVVMDPIRGIKPYKDSTFAMLLAAQSRGWHVHYLEPGDLYVRDGEARGRWQSVTVRDNRHDWHTLGPGGDVALGSLDLILMRQDPPITNAYLYVTHILGMAEAAGALVVNRPGSVRDANEKLFATRFPHCMTPTLVSNNLPLLRAFIQEQVDVIVKPLDAMGGAGIFRLTAGGPNIGSALEMLTANGELHIMAQRYIPEITDGDKRILMVDGEPLPWALARIPQGDDIRGNLAAGGRGEGRPLTERDRWIAAQVGPTLKEMGLIFVGLDVIGDYLTEINVTSPTCIRELDASFGLDIAGQLLDHLAARLVSAGRHTA
jgi:glutathione synthase